jgi:hypothetical protein
VLGPFYVVELAGIDRPEEDEPASEADKEHENDESDDRPKHTTTFLDMITGLMNYSRDFIARSVFATRQSEVIYFVKTEIAEFILRDEFEIASPLAHNDKRRTFSQRRLKAVC